MAKLITLDNLRTFKSQGDLRWQTIYTNYNDTQLFSISDVPTGIVLLEGAYAVYNCQDVGTGGAHSYNWEILFIDGSKRRYAGTGTTDIGLDDAITSPYAKPYATEAEVSAAIAAALVSVYKFAGSATPTALNALTKSAALNGNVYNVSDDNPFPQNLYDYAGNPIPVNLNDNVVFVWDNGEWGWDNLGSSFDFSTLVPNTRKVAGNALSSDISSQTLTDSLVTASTSDINGLFNN